jgi:hypothetical protein
MKFTALIIKFTLSLSFLVAMILTKVISLVLVGTTKALLSSVR